MGKEFNSQKPPAQEQSVTDMPYLSNRSVQHPGDAAPNLTFPSDAPQTPSQNLSEQIPNLNDITID